MSVPPTPKKGVAVLTEGLTTEKKLDRYSVMEERVFVKHKKLWFQFLALLCPVIMANVKLQ